MNEVNSVPSVAPQTKPAPTRKLSLIRVLIALVVLAGVIYFAFFNFKEWQGSKLINVANPWFAPYVDVTATPQYNFEKLGSTSAHNLVLSFVVSSSTDACTPTWGNAYTLDKADAQLDLDRRIARLRQLGGDIAVSFGGMKNDELAVNCTDRDKLLAAYVAVIQKYNVGTIDFDIEGTDLTATEANIRRAVTLAKLQQNLRAQGKDIAIWLTLPVTPNGLSEDGTNVVAQMLSNGVDLAGVNIMTMDYGQSRAQGQTMQDATQKALTETHRQLGVLYSQAGITLSSSSLWKKVGATPMIGQNDVLEEVFSLDDAKALNSFAVSNGIVRLSMWSANRDIQCGDNYVNTTIVSDSCSGVKQAEFDYALTLQQGLSGNFEQNVSATTEDPDTNTQQADDPATSPYQIWSEDGVYLEGTKVVWHHNVYQAKWWTQGDLPDNPVLQSWQTPWQLVGPVLPGEKPILQATLPAGTYPEWAGTKQYDEGDRILFNGVPYQAKWWTQGDSPAASSSNPTSSPWVALTQAQIEQILNKK